MLPINRLLKIADYRLFMLNENLREIRASVSFETPFLALLKLAPIAQSARAIDSAGTSGNGLHFIGIGYNILGETMEK